MDDCTALLIFAHHHIALVNKYTHGTLHFSVLCSNQIYIKLQVQHLTPNQDITKVHLSQTYVCTHN